MEKPINYTGTKKNVTEERSRSFAIELQGLKYGAVSAASLVIYFIIMRLAGLARIVEFRYLNFIIMALIIGYAIKHIKRVKGDTFKYYQGLGLGIATAFFNALFFTIFMVSYVFYLDSVFINKIKEGIPLKDFLDPFSLTVALFFELLVAGFIISFIFMQYYKPHIPSGGPK